MSIKRAKIARRLLALLACFVLLLTGCSGNVADKQSVGSDDQSMTWGKWLGLYYESLSNLAKQDPEALAKAYSYIANEQSLTKLLSGNKLTLDEWRSKYGYLLKESYVSSLFVGTSTIYEEWVKMYGFNFEGAFETNGKHPTVDTPWQAVPMVTAEVLAQGYTGGEGCQWPLYITTSATDPGLAFMGTDVGGLYRTTDGGKNWAIATVGLFSSAATGIAIDPKNANRVLCIGCNSTYWGVNGIYLSKDKGESWEGVFTYNKTQNEYSRVCGYRDFRHQLAFDETSYDKKLGYCTVAYWSRDTRKYDRSENNSPALLKSTDGGESWEVVNTAEYSGGSETYVSPSTGWVFLGHKTGLYRSKDGGKSFDKILDVTALGVDIITTRKNTVYVCAKEGFYISKDNGDNFEKIDAKGYPTDYPARIRVSPVNPNNMMLQDDHLSAGLGYTSKNYYSHDGGKTWHISETDSSNSFIPYNVRQTVFAWSCEDENLCISTGGDMIMRSENAGAKFVWGGNGYNGACATSISHNVNNPNFMAVGNQDYNGGYTLDAGKTWTYINWSGNPWGGYSYGGYVVDENHIIALKSGGWHADRVIAYTTDGGETITTTDYVVKSQHVYGAYGKNDIVFAGQYRSTDKGVTWSEMSGCIGVCTHNADGALFGINEEGKIVRSDDYGVTWSELGLVAEGVKRMVYDFEGKRLVVLANKNVIYTVTEEGKATVLYSFAGFKDITGDNMDIRDIAVDPENSDCIFVCNARGVYASACGVLRSTDGGKTWLNCARNVGDGSRGLQGARDISHLDINPLTRELFTSGACRGIYKMALPEVK